MTKAHPKILIAEDDFFLGKYVRYELIRYYCDVDRVNDGEKAVEKLRKNKYDLVLLDNIMPNKTGLQTLRELRQLKIETPVMIFSNLEDNDMQEEARRLKAEYYIKSELSLDQFVKIVQGFLKKIGAKPGGED